jgi:sulfur carrier protein
MRLIVNGEDRVVADDITVDGIIDAFAIERRGTAVAVNGDVTPRSTWPQQRLQDGDRIEVLTASQGG